MKYKAMRIEVGREWKLHSTHHREDAGHDVDEYLSVEECGSLEDNADDGGAELV